ncbi:Ataxin-2-like protein [Plecturocebus cupreus]
MLHFLTAAVGSTCDVRVKNGATYEGIFKTLSSKFELAADAALRRASEPAGGPHREDIVDSTVYAAKDNHCHELESEWGTQREGASAMEVGGDSSSDGYDLESDMSNGWDPNEMLKFNEENHGVKTTYDGSLSSHTVPLEKDSLKELHKRQLLVAQLA